MLPNFETTGNLPPGVHWATWAEFEARFGSNDVRRKLLSGLRQALESLRDAGCVTVYIDGSFVTAKSEPADYDVCWDITGVNARRLDPRLLDRSNRRAAQKSAFYGEFFPADLPEGASGRSFLEFFQFDKLTGQPKGIAAINLRQLP
jgi:hypothetical protein